MLTRPPNPDMVVLAREVRGWTQTNLADAVGLAQSIISKHETSLEPMTDKDVQRYADATEFEAEFFYEQRPILRLDSTFLFNRKRAKAPVKLQRRSQAEINVRRMQLGRLLYSAERRSEYSFPSVDIDDFRGRPEAVATYLREHWRIQPGPITNLTQIVEHFGGVVIDLDFGTTLIDATHIWEPGLPPMFFINSVIPGDRYRFTLAHEIGHAVMHHTNLPDDPEADADSFASAFLMPQRDIQRDLVGLKMEHAMRLKKAWGASIQAIIRRARDLNKITESNYRRMMTAISAGGARMEEPLPIDREIGSAFQKLLAFHENELRFTSENMRKLMFTDHLNPIPPKVAPKMKLVGLFEGQALG